LRKVIPGVVVMEERLITHNGLFLLFSTFLNSIPVGYINVVPLVYLAQIGYDPSTIGIIYSASAIAATIGLIPCGFLADRYGKKKLLIIGTFLPCLAYAIFGLTLNPAFLTIASVVGGVGFAGGLGAAITTPSFFSMLASSTSDKRRSTLFGVLFAAWSIALTVGSALSFLPSLLSSSFTQSERAAHFESYIIMSGVAAASVIPLFFVKERRDRGGPKTSSGSNPALLQFSQRKMPDLSGRRKLAVASWSRILQFSTVFALTGFGLGVLVQLLPTWYTMRYGASESAVGVWMAVSNLTTIISIPIIPRIVNRRGAVSTAAATGVVGALVLALMPFTAAFESSAALFAIRSLAVGISWPVLQSYMMGIVNENERATMVGFAYTAWGVGTSLGVVTGGEFLGVGLLMLPFVAGVASYLVSSAALPLFFRKVKPPEETTRFVLPRMSE
jgi:MFS family permease